MWNRNRSGRPLWDSLSLGRGSGIVPIVQNGNINLGACNDESQNWAGGIFVWECGKMLYLNFP